MSHKKETVEEFLARGGRITKVQYSQPEIKETIGTAPASGHSSLMTYDAADLYYGEAKRSAATKAVKSKKHPSIDFSALPPELQKSLLEELDARKETSDA